MFEIRYVQSLSLEQGEGPLQSNGPRVEAIFDKQAAAGGFLARLSQRDAGKALNVLTAMALYARPLIGDEFQLLYDHGLVTRDDHGKLFSWMTKMGLAQVLGITRETVITAINWLLTQRIVLAVTMPPSFIEQYVRTRGQFTSNTIYVLNTGDLLFTDYIPATTPSTVTVSDEPTRAAVTMSDEPTRSPCRLSRHSMSDQPTQSLNNHDDHDEDTRTTLRLLELQTTLVNTWRAHLGSDLPPAQVDILVTLLQAEKTNLAILQALMAWLAQQTPRSPPDRRFAQLLAMLEGHLPPEIADVGIPPDGAVPISAAPSAHTPEVALGLPASPPKLSASAPVLTADPDPILTQVILWYEQEIGEAVTPFAAEEIRNLTTRYRDLAAWKDAFTKAAATPQGLARWAYVVSCMEGSHGQFKLDRKPKTTPRRAAGGRGQSRRAPAGTHVPSGQRGGRRAPPPVVQFTPAEHAQLEAAAAAELPALEAELAARLAHLGLDLEGQPLSGDPPHDVDL